METSSIEGQEWKAPDELYVGFQDEYSTGIGNAHSAWKAIDCTNEQKKRLTKYILATTAEAEKRKVVREVLDDVKHKSLFGENSEQGDRVRERINQLLQELEG